MRLVGTSRHRDPADARAGVRSARGSGHPCSGAGSDRSRARPRSLGRARHRPGSRRPARPLARRRSRAGISPDSHHAYTDRHASRPGSRVRPLRGIARACARPHAAVSIDRSGRPSCWCIRSGDQPGLAIFWTASRFADRLGHLLVIWGSVVAGFFVNTSLVIVQLASGSTGLFGFIEPGGGSRWASGLIDPCVPNLIDVLESPGASTFRATSARRPPGHLAMAGALPGFPNGHSRSGRRSAAQEPGLPRPGDRSCVSAVPWHSCFRSSLREEAANRSRASRLAHSGQTSLVILIYVMLLASALMIGLLAGPLFSVPFGVGLLVVGLPARAGRPGLCGAVRRGSDARSPPLGRFGSGAAAGREVWATSTTYPPPVEPISPRVTTQVWSDAVPIIRDFPLLGTGLGTFASIYPYYKSRDAASTTALSSVLQWWVESGLVGLVLLALGAIWVIWRIPGSVRRVGTADRVLAFGLIGAASGFTLYSVVHWTVELTSVALAASAVGGTMNRWLAGGTDLFVERG